MRTRAVFTVHAEDGLGRLLGAKGISAFYLHSEKRENNSSWLGGNILGQQLRGYSYQARGRAGPLSTGMSVLGPAPPSTPGSGTAPAGGSVTG